LTVEPRSDYAARPMPSFRRGIALVAVALVAHAESPRPPVARKVPHLTQVQGQTLSDDYFWLRERDTRPVLQHLQAENRYSAAVMKPTQKLQAKLYKELVDRVPQSDVSVPYLEGGHWYYTKLLAGQQYPVHARRAGTMEAREQVVLDVNALAKGHPFYSVSQVLPSDDGKLFAYAFDLTGGREYSLRIKNLITGKLLADRLEGVDDFVWAADGKHLFYVTHDGSLRAYRLWRHALGTPAATDALLFEEKDEKFELTIARPGSRGTLVLTTASKNTTEEWLLDAARPQSELKVVLPRQPGVRYAVEPAGDELLIRINDQGINHRLVSAPATHFEKKAWKELVPHRSEVLLSAVEAFAGFFILHERADGLARFSVIDRASGEIYTPQMAEPVYAFGAEENHQYAATGYRFRYSSLTTPPSVFEYDVASREAKRLKEQEIRGFDPGAYRALRLWAQASDGARIPISLVYRKDLRAEGPQPLLLHGYGAYGISSEASFKPERISLLDRGVVFAIAHVRGGSEMGQAWYEAGKLTQKQNSFTDFIAAAEGLIEHAWTTPQQLAIHGRSAGGLLMAAVANLRPDLFKVVLPEVPFVDVVNSMLDSAMPLTIPEYEEWGDPNQPEVLKQLLAYSPYDNLAAKAYPAMLVRTAYHDTQVQYWEPVKLVAKLRALKTDSNPLLLVTNMGSGHGGASGRYDHYRETAHDYAFVLTQLGVEPVTPAPKARRGK
jgi:oligopeptidase B